MSAALTRWGIEADSSAGQGLGGLPVGVLLGLMARAAARPMDPVLLLALLKHRFTRLGYAPLALAGRARTIERLGLRGVAPRDRDMLLARMKDHPDAQEAAGRLLDCVALAAAAFADGPARAPDAMRAVAEAMEKLAIDDRGSPGELWAGPGGESAASLIAGVLREAEPLPPCDAAAFAGLVERLVADETVRTGGASHPRLRILGAMEARLVRADRLILAGLEEGVWPQSPRLDPFLSRSMRTALGLPPPERRIGLAAHDFAQAACAPDVLLITSARRDGQPAVRSRWLWRLETLARGAGAEIDGGETLRGWRRRLDERIWPAPPALAQAARPAPAPPLAARPRSLPVTAVETWVRDPYAVYARRILNLRPMDRPAKPFDNRSRGSAIHAAAERFARAWPTPGEDPAAVFARAYLAEVSQAGATDTDLVREAALAARTGAWMAEFERGRRAGPVTLVMEETGEMVRPGPAGPFRITAKADRLEVVRDRVNVLDFKTGAPPSEKEVEAGFSPQLTLTAAIVRAGGYAQIGPAKIGALTYVRLTGRGDGGETRGIGAGREDEMADAAVEGLDRWIARFDDPKQPYVSRLAVKFLSSPSDYDHLARRQEWASGAVDGGDE